MWRKIPYFYGNTIVPSEVVTVLDKKLRTQTPINCTLSCERRLPFILLLLCSRFESVSPVLSNQTLTLTISSDTLDMAVVIVLMV